MVKALELLNQEAGLPGRGKLLPNRDDPNFKIQHRILEVATKQFVQFGYRKTSISDIADHAGIGKGSLYLHYKSKQELFLSCQLEEQRVLYEQFDQISEMPKKDRLKAYLECTLTFATSAPISKALLTRPQDYAALINEMGVANIKNLSAAGTDLIVKNIISSANKELRLEDQKSLAVTISLLTSAIGHLPEIIFEMSEVQVKDFVKTLVSLLDHGTRNLKHT